MIGLDLVIYLFIPTLILLSVLCALGLRLACWIKGSAVNWLSVTQCGVRGREVF